MQSGSATDADRLYEHPSAVMRRLGPRRRLLAIERQRAAFASERPGRLAEESYAGLDALLEELRDAAAEDGIRLLVVLAPDQYQVDPRLRDAVAKSLGVPTEQLWSGIPQRRIQDRLDDLGIPACDLLPTFRGVSDRLDTYLPRDSHWNEYGNRLAAEAIYEFYLEEIGAPARTSLPPPNANRTQP